MNFKKTFFVGSIIGLLNVAVTNFYVADRPIGASTSYPYFAGLIFDLQNSAYFQETDKAGSWELLIILRASIGAVVGATVFKHFNVQAVPPAWIALKGSSKIKRLFWAFVGGFILITGARLADGCTSGHILSGGMELGLSSLIFAFFVLISLVVTAKFFTEVPSDHRTDLWDFVCPDRTVCPHQYIRHNYCNGLAKKHRSHSDFISCHRGVERSVFYSVLVRWCRHSSKAFLYCWGINRGDFIWLRHCNSWILPWHHDDGVSRGKCRRPLRICGRDIGRIPVYPCLSLHSSPAGSKFRPD